MSWQDVWQRGSYRSNPDFDRDLRRWVATLPLEIRMLMVKYPPGCLVRAVVPLHIPAPGTVGVVISYGARGPKCPLGWLGVVQSPTETVRAVCVPEQLDVVGFRQGFDHAAMQAYVPETVVFLD